MHILYRFRRAEKEPNTLIRTCLEYECAGETIIDLKFHSAKGQQLCSITLCLRLIQEVRLVTISTKDETFDDISCVKPVRISTFYSLYNSIYMKVVFVFYRVLKAFNTV